ncbi:MAG: hypothetical protein PGMFKBFP_01076 [Anaerolineales bacterium]|nr:hypothetical protein [Anaerolineales bacterium]
MKQLQKIAFALTLFCFVALLLLFLIPQVNFAIHRNDYKKKTTPLPKETVEILCDNFSLEKEDKLCNGKKEVYAPDFFRTINSDFKPYEEYQIESSESATYEEVQEKIGAFQFKCEPTVTTGDGFSYFLCSYDLRGDRFYTIVIFFSYPDMAVFRMTSTSLVYDY